MRLIDADKLPVRSIDETDLPRDKGLLVVLKEDIDNAPTVDLWEMRQEATENALKKAEVLYTRPQGEWILIDDTEKFIAKCSICGRIEDSRMIKYHPFCHCGARMKGSEK